MKKYLSLLSVLTLGITTGISTNAIIASNTNNLLLENKVTEVPDVIKETVVNIIGIIFKNYPWENKDHELKPGDLVVTHTKELEAVLKKIFPEIVRKMPIFRMLAPYIDETMELFHIDVDKDAPKVLNEGTTIVGVKYVIDQYSSDGTITFLNV